MKYFICLVFLFGLSFSQIVDYSNQKSWYGSCNAVLTEEEILHNKNEEIVYNIQSPISINSENAKENLARKNKIKLLETHFTSLDNITREVMKNGKVRFKFENVVNNFIIIEKDGEEYKFIFTDMFVHCPAEHNVNNLSNIQCELQLYHERNFLGQKDVQFKYLAVSLLLSSAVADTALLSSNSINFSNYFSKSSQFYYYDGSNTLPPCTENVTWLVLANSVPTSNLQIAELISVINANFNGGNNRQVVELSAERKVYYLEGVSSYISLNFLIATLISLFLI
jgi:carbonic anhydrase